MRSTHLSPLSLHDALPISVERLPGRIQGRVRGAGEPVRRSDCHARDVRARGRHRHPDDGSSMAVAATNGFTCAANRSEEHTSELQSQSNLVCRLLLEKKKK